MIERSKSNTIFLVTMMAVILDGCVEPFDAKTEVFEDVIVIDALLTDEDVAAL